MNQDTPPPAVPVAPVSGGTLDPGAAAQGLDPTMVPPGTAQVVHDLSVWALFLQADWIVKAVIIVLLLASIWSWAIIFDKMIRLRGLRSRARRFEESFWSG